MLNAAPVVAAPLWHNAHSNAEVLRAQHTQVLAGRVIAVRRVTREVTIRTGSGDRRTVAIARDATVRAHGAAGLNAVRSGVNVQLDTAPGRNGKPEARSVTVH